MQHRALVMILGFLIRGGDRLAVLGDSEGLPAARGYRADFRLHRSQSRHFLRRDENSPGSHQSYTPGRSNVRQFYSGIADSNGSRLNNGYAFLHLKNRSDRPWTDSAAYDRLRTTVYGHVAVADSALQYLRPLFERHMTIDDVIHRVATKAGPGPWDASFSPESARNPHRRPIHQEPVSIHAVESGNGSAL